MLIFQKNWCYSPVVFAGMVGLGIISPLSHAETPQKPLYITQQVPTSNTLNNALSKAETLNLAEHITWRRLLHYPDLPTKAKKNQHHSQISDDKFFVVSNGKTDPHAELVAMLTQLYSETPDTTNSVQCRFPARTHWLKQMLDINDSDLPSVSCSDTKAWLDKVHPDGVWLIFAEEYLDSPASAFGHSFLRLDNAKTGKNYILNYEPKVTEGESFLKFSYKSITGIDGVFSVMPYDEKIKQYRDHDGRDIWRYQLNLSEGELQQLARQIWEIKDQHPTYRLASDNCASEILLLLNALHPDKNYLKDFNKLVTPADIVRALNQQGMIKDMVYEPSLKSQMQAQINATHFGQQPLAFAPRLPLIPADNNPLTTTPLSVASIGIGQENGNPFTQLGYRGIYHDSLDKRSGYPTGYYLDALSAKVRLINNTDGKTQKNQHVRLEEATLINARSLNPINTAESQKPWGGHSWGGKIGLTQVIDGFADPQKDAHNHHLVTNMGAEYGWSMAYGKPNMSDADKNIPIAQTPVNICYALAIGNAQLGKGLSKGYRIGVGATLGCIHQFGERWRGTLAMDLPYWYQYNGGEYLAKKVNNKHGYWQPQASLGIQYDLKHHQALRLNGTYIWQPNALADDKTAQIAYLYYF